MSPLWRRSLAIDAGFAAVAALSIGADGVMHALRVYPDAAADMSGGLFILAATYRALFTVLGGVIATMGAGEGSYRPAQILAGLGLLGGLAGLGVGFATPDLGPLWYVASIPISAIPCTLLGAWLVLRRRD